MKLEDLFWENSELPRENTFDPKKKKKEFNVSHSLNKQSRDKAVKKTEEKKRKEKRKIAGSGASVRSTVSAAAGAYEPEATMTERYY